MELSGRKNDAGLRSVKMRASLGGCHISGAERIVAADQVPKVVASLAGRAMSHERGVPDFVNIKVELTGDVVQLKALPVSTVSVATPEEGWRAVRETLAEAGVPNVPEIASMFAQTYSMRGAMLLDADTLERLESDPSRGVRATYMDVAGLPVGTTVKNHFAEALVLATKVLSAPGIVAEVCVSDDPGYVTGYVATRQYGYRRITVLKERGSAQGGRIFLYRGRREDVPKTIDYLERQAVLVGDMPSVVPCRASARMSGIDTELADITNANLERRERVLEGPTGPFAETGGRRMSVMCSNDYLDLAHDSRVIAAAQKAAGLFGAGSGGSRLVTGTQSPHAALEAALARFKGTEAAIVFPTGYMANVGTITAIARRGDVILSDELNHASIIDGCRMSGAEVAVYPHLDFDALDSLLGRCAGYRRRLVVSDGVFSMDGDMLDLPRFLEICGRHDAFSMVDEAHSVGVVGKTGRGLCEHFGCGLPDLAMGTLSKALGSQGGYVCASERIVKYLRQKSRPYIFTTAPAASAMAAAEAALHVLEAEPWRVERLRENVAFFLSELAKGGIEAHTESAIVPIIVGDEGAAVAMSAELEKRGFLVSAIRYPTVARSKARLRVAIMSSHGREALSSLAAAIMSKVSSAEAMRPDNGGTMQGWVCMV